MEKSDSTEPTRVDLTVNPSPVPETHFLVIGMLAKNMGATALLKP